MAIKVRQKSVDYIKNLISRGQVDSESSWSFEADDENRLIEEKGWDVFMNVHIAYDDEGNEDAKDTYKFPVAKLKGDEVTVFRYGVIAAKQRAAQQGYDNVFEAASSLLEMIDEKYGEEEDEKKKEKGIDIPTVSFREADIERKEEDVFEVSISSETPVQRWGYWEVLEHDRSAIVDDYLKAGIPVLVNHDRDKIIGVSEGWAIRNGKLYVQYRLSKTAEPWKTLIEEGILRHTSIGYEILETESEFAGERDGLPVVYVRKWRPLEFSFVSIPADISVGVGRAKEDKREEVQKMEAKEEMKEVRKEEVPKMAERIIDTIPAQDLAIDKNTYSLKRVIDALMEGKAIDGYEAEIHQEIEKRTGKPAQGVYVPTSIFTRVTDLSGLKETKFYGAGEYPLAGILQKAGAQVVENTVGTFTVAVMGSYPAMTWGTSGSAVDLNITGYELAPMTGFIWTPFYRNALKQANIEDVIRKTLSNAIANGIEKAVIQGNGHTSSQPLGITNFNWGTGYAVKSDTVTAWAYSDLVTKTFGAVAGNIEPEKYAFLMNAATFATLKTTARETGHPTYIVGQDNSIDGFRVLVSANIPDNTVIFGKFDELLVVTWGAIDLLVNPYSAAPAVRLDAYVYVDSAIMVPATFAVVVKSSGNPG